MPRVPDTFQAAIAAPGAPRFANPIDPAAASAPGRRLVAEGRQLTETGVRIQNDIDEARVREADVLASRALTDLLNNPETGFLNLKGKAAVDGFRPAQEALEKALREAGGGLTTERQRAMLRRTAEARGVQAFERLGEHAAKQASDYNASQAEARIGALADEVAANPFDARLGEERRAVLRGEVATLARIRGWAPEVAQRETLKALTAVHGAVLDNMIARDRGEDARDYFARHLDEIDPTQRAKIEGTVKQAAVRSESLSLSMRLPGSFGEQRDTLKTMFGRREISAELHDATLQRLAGEESLRRAAEQESSRQALGAVQDWFIRHPGASVAALPPRLYETLKAQGNLDAAMSLAKWGQGESEPGPADRAALYTELMVARDADPEGFVARFDPRRYVGRLTPTQLGQLAADVKDGVFDEFTAGVKMIRDELAAAGLDPTPTLDPTTKPSKQEAQGDTARQWSLFQASYMDLLRDTRRQLGRRLTGEEKRKLRLDLLGDVVLETRWTDQGVFGPKPKVTTNRGRLYQMAAVRAPEQIPAVTRAGLVRDLTRQLGRQPTPAEIVNTYRQRAFDRGTTGDATR